MLVRRRKIGTFFLDREALFQHLCEESPKVGKIPVNVKSGEASMNSNLLLLSVRHGRRRNRVEETKGLHSYFPFKK